MSFASAQTAIQTSKLTDNISFGAHLGLTSPISYENLFPMNATFGFTVGKQVTPILGFNVEGTTWMGSNSDKPGNRFDSYVAHNTFRALDFGVNTTLNFTNLFSGYKGKPRVFEYGFEGGFGWLHTMIPNSENKNDLSAKTQMNLMLNLGSKRAHTIGIAPVIWWNLTSTGHAIKFNRKDAQFGILATYIYHMKNSAGTHYLKMYDIAEYENTIAELQAENEELKNKEPITKVEVFEFDNTKPAGEKIVAIPAATVIYFAVNDATLDDAAKAELDKFPAGVAVNIIGTASPEGTEARNLQLSQERADVTAGYLKDRGVNVVSAVGKGVATGSTSNRVAIVKVVLLDE